MNSFLPMNESILSHSLTIFQQVFSLISGFVSVIFIMRICFSVVKIAGPSEYGSIFVDAISFLGLGSLLPTLLKLLIDSAGHIAEVLAAQPLMENQSFINKFFERIFFDFPGLMIFGKIGDIAIVAVAQSIYSIFLSLLISSAPIFLFLGTMLGIQGGVKAYFGLLVTLCLWPIMWNLLSRLSIEIGGDFKSTPILSVVFYIVIQILQLLSPIFSYTFFKSMSLSSGLGVVKSITVRLWP
jgi:hypothetical protein